MNKIIIITMCLSMIFFGNKAHAQTIESEVVENNTTQTMEYEYSVGTRASRIFVGESWYLDYDYCMFSFSLLQDSTGTGYARLEKKNGSNWVNCGNLNFEFKNRRFFDGSIDINNLTSGTYRLVISATVGSNSEEKTLETKYL